MAALVDRAQARTSEQPSEHLGPSPWVTALLTVLTPGLGHIYLGQARRGILLFVLVIFADTLLMFAMMGVLARFWMFAVSAALLLGLWLFVLVDAVARAVRMRAGPHPRYNKPAMCAGAFVAACLIFAAPCVYAFQAQTSGRLLWLNAGTSSMEPTLRTGEYFLADATYYRTRQPARGDVAVYVHPMEPSRQLIKRIVAVEGDRIAVRGGGAIVNGMAVEEPYVDARDVDGPFANMRETRVPVGHVFVLGDNRSRSLDLRDADSRDLARHGPVPVGNLKGRVTDIAISRHLARLGRWVGTPKQL
jgi:signal peptidase I